MFGLHMRILGIFISCTALTLSSPSVVHADGDPAIYSAAVPMLETAGGGKTCVECFLEKFAPAEFNKAFAVSKDGAYGGRWSRNESMETVREKALESCRKKPVYRSGNPCVIFFENDKLVWTQ